jgi:hypothetical protein
MKTSQAMFGLRVHLAVLIWLLGVTTISASAQGNELALTMGAYFPMHVNARSDNVFAIQGNIAHRMFHVPVASLFIELPITGALDSPVSATKILSGQSFNTKSYSALFITPGLRLEFIPTSPLSPYLALGGGLAHFSRTQTTNSSSTNTGVLDIGGGLDWKVARFLSLRGEVRDFYSGGPELINGLTDREHQIVATGGVVVRF